MGRDLKWCLPQQSKVETFKGFQVGFLGGLLAGVVLGWAGLGGNRKLLGEWRVTELYSKMFLAI